MCYVKFKSVDRECVKNELTTKQWIELGNMAADNGALTIFFTGGEPLIREDFKEIYEAYNRLGLRLNLFTNGTLVTEEFVKWLAQAPPAAVDVTLYGSSDETYFNLCGQKSVYKKVINAIELLIKYKINTRIKTTIVKTNLNDYKDIEYIAKSYELQFVPSNLIHGNRNTGIIDIEKERLSPEEVYKLSIDDLDIVKCKNIDIENLKHCYENIPAMFCAAGKSSFFINWKGEMVPCPLFEKPFTNPLEIGYKQAWDMLRKEISKIPGNSECDDCQSRAFCHVCPARLYLETGKFDGHSDYVCKLAEEKEKVIKRILLKI